MNYTCPVCGYDRLHRPPEDHLICPSCGTEFEYDDLTRTHDELRREWVQSGARWFSSKPQPQNWSPFEQLKKASLAVPVGEIRSIKVNALLESKFVDMIQGSTQLRESRKPQIEINGKLVPGKILASSPA